MVSMKKLLFYGEGPHNTTGFSLQNKHLTNILSQVCELEYVATTHWQPELDTEAPYVIHACPPTISAGAKDPASRNLEKILARLEAREWDIFFHQGDIGANDDVVIRAIQIAREDTSKKTIYWAPLDVDEFMPECLDVLSLVDVPVVFTERAVERIEHYRPDLAGCISVIGLGTEPDVFFPMTQEERKEQRKRIFGIEDDTFVVINVNRNQSRKDLARTMACFHQFHQTYPHSMLYLHAVIQDYGGNLMSQAKLVGMDVTAKPAEVAFSSLNLHEPWARKDLNCLYNAADCFISTSYGEGWGLPTTEAMCAGTPVCVPYNTANIDLLGPRMERGWGMKTGGDLDHTTYLYEGGGSPHDVVWAESFVHNLVDIYLGTIPGHVLYEKYYHAVQAKTQAAHLWGLQNTWKMRGEIWKALLEVL